MPNKSLGQHWLFDPPSLESIVGAAELRADDTVLEIGPGLGPLTAMLATRVQQVVAVEFDPDLARELPKRVPAANVRVVHSDILRFNLSELPAGYTVVANIPYYLTNKIVRLLLESPTPPSVAVLLVQKEVAERLAAKPGDMSILAVAAQFYAEVSLGPVVPADRFSPQPKVDSQVVVIRHRARPLFDDVDPKMFFRVVKAGFSGKRKTLRNSLGAGLGIAKADADRLLDNAGIDANRRAETLALHEWRVLTKAIVIEQ